MASISLPNPRYLEALKRQRESIAAGLPFKAVNSEELGEKFVDCSWGLCSRAKEAWPEPNDHLWPDQFVERGRVAPLYLKGNQACPLSREIRSAGCFYTCMVFNPTKGAKKPTREEALALYDAKIAKHTPLAKPVAQPDTEWAEHAEYLISELIGVIDEYLAMQTHSLRERMRAMAVRAAGSLKRHKEKSKS